MINPNRKTELEGVHYVQGVVQKMDSSFESFSHHNDQGNDCYIEFVKDRIPTNYGVFVQIKSGPSFKDHNGYKIPADKAHLEYWSKNLYKTIGIVYDPEIQKAFWIDISDYIKANQQILLQAHHSIRISSQNEFSENSFIQFMEYCFKYKEELQSFENFGRSLELYSEIDKSEICYEGLKSLYSNHRTKKSTWFYLLSNFRAIEFEGIRRNLLGLVSNNLNHANIFWHRGNIHNYPTTAIEEDVKSHLTKLFGSKEIELMIPYMKEGVVKGSFSYLVFQILNAITNVHVILKEMAFEDKITAEDRYFTFWLYLHIAKYHSVDETLRIAKEFLEAYPDGKEDDAILGVIESIQKGDLFTIGT
jgi:hypothetical protein